jgi:hypothetical protein
MKIIKTLVASLLLVGSLYSQEGVKRISIRDSFNTIEFTRRYNDKAIEFNSPLCCEEAVISVNVLSDSIGLNKYTLGVYVYFPLNFNPINSTMLINYVDGNMDILYQREFPDSNNYVEYYLLSQEYNFILTRKVKSITFRGIGVFKVEDKTFFIDFYNKIK